MNTLKVKHIPELNTISLKEAINILENETDINKIDCVNWAEYSYKPTVEFHVARSDDNFFILYTVNEQSTRAMTTTDGSEVYFDSCVEFFMQTVSSNTYTNFEFNAIGTCDSSRRESRDSKTTLSADEFQLIKRYSTLGTEPFDETHLTDKWQIIVSIPLSVMGLDKNKLPEKIKGNFYKCGDATTPAHYISWNAITLEQPNFHCPNFFGEIYF